MVTGSCLPTIVLDPLIIFNCYFARNWKKVVRARRGVSSAAFLPDDSGQQNRQMACPAGKFFLA